MSRRAVTRTASRRGNARPGKRAGVRRKQGPGMLDRAISAIPLSEAALRRVTTWSIVTLVCAAGLGAAAWAGVPAMVGTALAEGVGSAGFRVKEIEIGGLRHMDQMTVYATALDQKSRAMPLVDLNAVRNRLIGYPWIADASVSRRWPDTLMIHVTERRPAAIWQNNGQLMLIDREGVPLEPVSPSAMPDLPHVIGDGANAQQAGYDRMMRAAPGLRRMVKAAVWIGNRRWDLLFGTGERLMLPEGNAVAVQALAKFAQIDRDQGLIGHGYVSFDLRDPTRMVLRTATRNRTVPAIPAPVDSGAAQEKETHSSASDRT